jgi:hypothetical protein
VLPDVKSQENAESQPPQGHNGKAVLLPITLFILAFFPFRPRFSHADMTVNSGFWRDAFRTFVL